jgi:hypothetical protein
MLKLFTVTVETEIVVLANSSTEAEELARDTIGPGGDISSNEFDTHAQPMSYLPGSWETDAIPYGEHDSSDPDRTIQSWIDHGAAPEFAQQRTISVMVNGTWHTIQRDERPWEDISKTITNLAKEHDWSPQHVKDLHISVHQDPVCSARLKAYVAQAPVGLAPRNITCPIHSTNKTCAASVKDLYLSYEDILGYAHKEGHQTVVYRKGPAKNPQGSLAPGEHVLVCHTMVFNVANTSNA